MALCGRFFRAVRTLVTPLAAISAFAFLLTFIFILYQPTPGPGALQRLGWQSWDAVTTVDYFDKGGQAPQDQPASSTEWWNVTTPAEDGSSYPTDAWVPLWPHDTGRAFPHSSLLQTLTSSSIRDCDHPVFGAAWLCRGNVRPQHDP